LPAALKTLGVIGGIIISGIILVMTGMMISIMMNNTRIRETRSAREKGVIPTHDIPDSTGRIAMNIKEQDSNDIGGSYQCNFILLSRKEKTKGQDGISGRETSEGCSSPEKNAPN
jgi:hypothetical protein